MPQEQLKKVYEDYSDKFQGVLPFEEFSEKMKNPENRKKVFQDLSSVYELPYSFEDFDRLATPETQYPFHGPRTLGAALTGFGTSNIGAEVAKLRGSNIQEMSQFQPERLRERIAFQAGRLAGDLPSMFVGGLVGTAGGLATGPGAILSGGAGAFALPRAIESVQRGETFEEALPEVGKSAALGALTAGTGLVVGKVAPLLKTPAEIGALTFGGAGLEGRLPTSEDIIEATALVYGLKFSNKISEKIVRRKAQIEKQLERDLKENPEQAQVKIDEQIKAIQELIKTEAAKEGIKPASPEEIRQRRIQERAEDNEIRSAISREKAREETAALVEPDKLEKAELTSRAAMIAAAEKTPGFDQALLETFKGLGELFKPGGELRSGVGFSEESYQKAKPHFQKAWEAYKAAGRDFRSFFSDMVEKGGENLRPFLDQFQREQATAIRQNFTQQTTERVNQASQSKPEERAPRVENIKWLSRIVFTPQRAVSTKLRSGFGKTNIEVNLEHPKAQDITYRILEQDSKTSQTIQNEITHATNTEAEFYKGISRLPQGLSSSVYSAERGVAGTWLKRVISNPAELGRVPQKYRKTVTSLLAHYKLTDAQIKGDPARGIPSYQDLMEQAGASKAQINAGLKKLQLADIRFQAGTSVFKDFKSYLSFVTRHLLMDPVQVQIKSYMKEHPELFPSQIKQTIEEQLLVARGEKSWIEDRVVDGIFNWFGRSSYKGFTSFSQLSRRGQANLKLGYRPVSAFVDLAHSIGNTLIKREGQPFWSSLKRTVDFMKSKEGRKFIKEEEEAGSLQIGLDVDYAGRPVPKEALWKPLGLRSASEVKQRQFALSFAYQNALTKGMSEPVAREYARRMLHLTQGTYVLSGMRHFMRAPIAKTLFQFKEYIGRTFELMHTFSGREWAEYAAFNLAMSGPRGLVLFAKSIPMLALLGVLDKVEEALNTYKGIGKELISGLPGAVGADVAAQATLQVAPSPEDAGGVLISDAIKVFKNFILPVLGPGRYLTARAIKEFGGDTIKSIIPEFRNLMDVWDSIVSQDGWVHNSEGKPVYQLNSTWEKTLKTLGASTIEENQLRVAERLRVRFEQRQRDSIKFLLRVATKDKLTGSDAQEAIRELGNLGIQSQSIENAFKQHLLDPKTRALLKARLSQKARVLEFYDFE